jgi:hypothetical protein
MTDHLPYPGCVGKEGGELMELNTDSVQTWICWKVALGPTPLVLTKQSSSLDFGLGSPYGFTELQLECRQSDVADTSRTHPKLEGDGCLNGAGGCCSGNTEN